MRVLWITNIPLPAAASMAGSPVPQGGGWLGATLGALHAARPDLDVVCTAWAWTPAEPFEWCGIQYVTLPRERPVGGITGVCRAWVSDWRETVPVASMQRLIAQVRPDIVHVHGTETPNALAALLAADEVPVLISLQGLLSEIVPKYMAGLGFADRLADVVSLEFAKGRGLTHTYLRMKRATRTERKSLAAARDVTGRTDFDRRVAQHVNPDVRYWHVDEALRSPFYEVDWAGPATDPPTILAVASDAPFKGVDVLLKAYAKVRRSQSCRLTMVGRFEGTHLWRSLGALQAELGLADHVDWIGPQPAESVAELMKGCGVFVSASRIENSSNSVCEAMLVGAPVIASRTGGTPSLIADGETGLLVAPGDHEALASALEMVLTCSDLASRLGRRARSVARARHDPERVAGQLLEVYGGLVGRRQL